jgi:hypothetical protein
MCLPQDRNKIMALRSIVRNDNVLSGRWVLDGTEIAIAAILADYKLGREACLETYASSFLTEDELDAIIAFEFPAIRDVAVRVEHYSVTIHCECGEDTTVAEIWPTGHVECICGRVWDVVVTARLREEVHELAAVTVADERVA